MLLESSTLTYILASYCHCFSHYFNCLCLVLVQEAISQVMPNTTATAFECKTGKIVDVNIFFAQIVQLCQKLLLYVYI